MDRVGSVAVSQSECEWSSAADRPRHVSGSVSVMSSKFRKDGHPPPTLTKACQISWKGQNTDGQSLGRYMQTDLSADPRRGEASGF
jgi:hypothetical protein